MYAELSTRRILQCELQFLSFFIDRLGNIKFIYISIHFSYLN